MTWNYFVIFLVIYVNSVREMKNNEGIEEIVDYEQK